MDKFLLEVIDEYILENDVKDIVGYIENILQTTSPTSYVLINPDSKTKKAFSVLFDTNLKLIDRCYKALQIDKYSSEAFAILNYIDDVYETNLDYLNTNIKKLSIDELVRFRHILARIIPYFQEFSKRQALKALYILSSSIEHEDVIIEKNISRLLFNLENVEEFVKYYNSKKIVHPYTYTLILILLVLNNDKRSKQVLDSMLKNYPSTFYFDCMEKFFENSETLIVQETYNELKLLFERYPYFIKWFRENKHR